MKVEEHKWKSNNIRMAMEMPQLLQIDEDIDVSFFVCEKGLSDKYHMQFITYRTNQITLKSVQN